MAPCDEPDAAAKVVRFSVGGVGDPGAEVVHVTMTQRLGPCLTSKHTPLNSACPAHLLGVKDSRQGGCILKVPRDPRWALKRDPSSLQEQAFDRRLVRKPVQKGTLKI